MTVAVACNLSDGVVLAADSAVTVPSSEGGVIKVYENAEKLFQLGSRPIGVVTYGLGALGHRSIGSYLAEFELRDPGRALAGKNQLKAVVEGLRAFFMTAYRNEVVPLLEEEADKKFAQIPDDEKPTLGLVVGGFSHGAFLSEIWHFVLPWHGQKGTAEQPRPQGSFGTNWFAMFEPIRRYVKGHDPAAIGELLEYFAEARGSPLTDEETEAVGAILERHEYQIPFGAMPIEEGVAHARFLVELVVNHHRYVVGAPVVGGQIRLGMVTYHGGRFQLLEPEG